MSHDTRYESGVELEARCVSCRHKWTMTDEQICNANANGAAMCPKCGCVATVERARSKGKAGSP